VDEESERVQLAKTGPVGTEMLCICVLQPDIHLFMLVSDIAIFVLKRDVKLQLTNLFMQIGDKLKASGALSDKNFTSRIL